MDFKKVLGTLVRSFKENDVNYAVMGGFALGLWGVPRGTVDLDFLVLRDDMPKVDNILKSLGYECKFATDNVSQYISPFEVFGEIDFLHAFRDASLGMLARAEQKACFDGSIKLKALIPEDIIGLKLQAIKNDPSRAEIDLTDIKELFRVRGGQFDWELLQGYIGMFGFDELFNDLRKKYGKVD